ncbi:MAG: quinol:cytochrome C oxidoreductase [Bacteroidia bacterium]
MEAVHFTPEKLNDRFNFSGISRTVAYALIGIGIILSIAGYFLASDPAGDSHGGNHAVTETHDQTGHSASDTPEEGHGGGHLHHPVTKGTRLLSNILIDSLYFLTIAMGALFFLTIHRVGNAGWHTAIKRVPEAITTYLPVGVVGFVALFFFLNNLFDWAYLHEGQDALIDLKRAYLNNGFFIGRSVVFFGLWIGAALWLRKLSVDQDAEGGLTHFYRSQTISAVFIIIFAISYSLFAVDWVKSLEPHWFSTIFGVYIFAGSMVSSVVTIYLLIVFLKSQGHMSYVNDAHMHDLGKYAFGFSVFWAYIWVAQYLLIWYANIPEEGIYYVVRYRVEDEAYRGYATFFYVNIFLNFFIPFFGLMTRNAKRRAEVFLPLAVIMLYGHWHDLFLMVMPGAMQQNPGVGILEVGVFAAFAGVFLLVVFNGLSKANLVPVNHPYLDESLHHTTGPV